MIGGNYYLKIEEHWASTYDVEATTLYNLTNFDSKIYDVKFNNDCSEAVVFMLTLNEDPSDSTVTINTGSSSFYTAIITLDLENPTDLAN